MAQLHSLPFPRLHLSHAHTVSFLTDDALASSVGVSMGFTLRTSGVSVAPYDSLNLGSHVGDDLAHVLENRARVLEAFGVPGAPCIVPNQVHGTRVVQVQSAADQAVSAALEEAQEGADAVLVTVPKVAACLCFADCVPVIIVSPTGHFVVAHAGWRGALAGMAGVALSALAQTDAQVSGLSAGEIAQECNIYIGPYIHEECFEVAAETSSDFEQAYGADVLRDARHVNLGAVVRADVQRNGARAERIADACVCTVCSTDRFFSYRASDGTTGRHGAFAVRKELQ